MKISFNPVHPQNAKEIKALESARTVLNNTEAILKDVAAQDQVPGVDFDTRGDRVVLTGLDLTALNGRESATFAYPPGPQGGRSSHGFPTDPVYLAEKDLRAVSSGYSFLDAQGANHSFRKEYSNGWFGLGEGRTIYTQHTPLPNNWARFEQLTQWNSGQWDFESLVINRPEELR